MHPAYYQLSESDKREIYDEVKQSIEIEKAKKYCDEYITKKGLYLQQPLSKTNYEWIASEFKRQYNEEQAEKALWKKITKDYVGILASTLR